MDNYENLKKEVDSIKIQLGHDNSSWYANPSILISVIALIFSFGTTIVSYINLHNEDVRANHREAMALIQRITKLPIENFELMQKNKGSGPGESLSAMINQENIILASQAANLLSRYPDTFSSTEYYAIASALASSNIVDRVPFLFENAIEKAESSNDYSVASRSYAFYLYSKGDYTEGKRFYEMALGVWNKFPERNMYFVNSSDLLTFLYWSRAELMAKNVKDAEELLNKAKDRLSRLSPGPLTESFANQIKYTVALIEETRGDGIR